MKDGYKLTEVGIIPNEWVVEKLEKLFTFKNGINKEKEFFGKGIPIVNYTDVYKKRGLYSNDIKGKVTVTKKELENFEVKKGDVFFTRTSETIEEIGMTSVILDDVENTVFSGFVLRGRPITTKLNIDYCKYCFSTNNVRKEIKKKSSYTTRALTSGTNLNSVIVPIPTLPEQQKIADILSTIDEQIENVDRLIEKTKELKKGLMQQLLTKGIGHTEFKETEVGMIPKAWEVKKLGQLFKLSSGNFLSQKNICEGPYAVYGGNGITGYHNEFLFRNEKIVIGRVGAKCGCVTISLPNSWITDNALYIDNKIIDFDDSFMFILLEYLDLNKYANQSAQPVISGQKIYSIDIGLPCKDEQKQIATIISEAEKTIKEKKNKKEKLQQLKKGLMQQLLTGKIRVK